MPYSYCQESYTKALEARSVEQPKYQAKRSLLLLSCCFLSTISNVKWILLGFTHQVAVLEFQELRNTLVLGHGVVVGYNAFAIR